MTKMFIERLVRKIKKMDKRVLQLEKEIDMMTKVIQQHIFKPGRK